MRERLVLLVEDHDDNRAIYSVYLRHYGYRVTDTANGRDALEIAARDLPDIILLDVSLPGIDGWTVARRLKEAPETRGIPIIALTAHALPEHERRARKIGFDSYLPKPVPPPRVLEEISKLLEDRS